MKRRWVERFYHAGSAEAPAGFYTASEGFWPGGLGLLWKRSWGRFGGLAAYGDVGQP